MLGRATLPARQLAVLFAGGAVLSFVAIAEPDAQPLVFSLIGIACLLSAGLAVALPWTSWRWSSDLTLLLPAFALIGIAQATSLLPQRSYGSLFILVFAWIGSHRRPGTSLWVLPMAAVAYVVPVLVAPGQVAFSLPGCIVTLSVSVLVGEVIARAMAPRVIAEQEVARSAETMRLTLESSGQPILTLDLDGRTTLVNRAAGQLLGYEPDELLGRDLHDVMHHSRPDGSPYPIAECGIQRALVEGRSLSAEDEVFWRRDGRPFYGDYRSEPIRLGDDLVGAVVTIVDVTTRREAEIATTERLHDVERAALTDPLTGIGNRRYADAFLSSLTPGDAVVLIDIDHFKQVNDAQGHVAGDDVLRRLGDHLAGQVRSQDHVARFGGEEFLLVLAGGSSTAVTTVERIAQTWNASGAEVTFSAGVAAHSAGRPPLETLAAADRALYAAKAQGRDRVVAADPGEAVRA
ncbi:MAG TPA: diguanylate cyclase [Mycobacteriales bacterium]|nr:diguanylate cyclase [Mycobacteriales bacterium]